MPEETAEVRWEPVTSVEPVEPAPVAESRPPRRRGRTTLLIAAAAVLGVVAGTCAGYLIQADREPTALPSLSQATLVQAKGPGPEPLSAAQDRRVKMDGDLRKLLLRKPAGAKDADWLDADDGWMGVAAFADLYEEPADAFADEVGNEFRRAAVRGWSSGHQQVTVRLIQYRQEDSVVAKDEAGDGRYWADLEESHRGWPIPGTEDGMAYVYDKPDTEPGYLPLYEAEAWAWRGDVTMWIRVYDTKPLTKKTIMGLAERQMERL